MQNLKVDRQYAVRTSTATAADEIRQEDIMDAGCNTSVHI